MKPKPFDDSSLDLLYKKYKKFLPSAFIIVACILIFIFFLIPQINDIFTLKDQRVVLEDRIAKLKTNIVTLQQMDDSEMNNQLETISEALPPDKDFSSMLNALAVASQKSQVPLGDYSFDVGTLSKQEKSSQLTLQLDVSVDGNAADMERFLHELNAIVPISEPDKIQVSDNQAEATIKFYYRPFPDLTFDPQAPITAISSQDLQTISTLQTWKDGSTVTSLSPTPIVSAIKDVSPTPISPSPLPSPIQILPTISPSPSVQP